MQTSPVRIHGNGGPMTRMPFFSQLLSGPEAKAGSTIRGYQNALRLFCGFITDARYGWAAQCAQRFGQSLSQILHDWNTVRHVSEFEGRPGRRPVSIYVDEVDPLSPQVDTSVTCVRGGSEPSALLYMSPTWWRPLVRSRRLLSHPRSPRTTRQRACPQQLTTLASAIVMGVRRCRLRVCLASR